MRADVVSQVLKVGTVPRGQDGGKDAGLLWTDVVIPCHAKAVSIDGMIAGLDILSFAMDVRQVGAVTALMYDGVGRLCHDLRKQHLFTLVNHPPAHWRRL